MEPELEVLMLFMEPLRKQKKYCRIWTARKKYRRVYIVVVVVVVV